MHVQIRKSHKFGRRNYWVIDSMDSMTDYVHPDGIIKFGYVDYITLRQAEEVLEKFKFNRRMNMHDSGERKEQSTGALSDPSHMNAAMELLSPYSLWQLSTWLGKGAKKYAPRNWEKGIPFSVCVGKLKRHLAEYMMGKTDEPHLDAVGFWWHALTHYEAMIALGKLPASLNDLPQYEKKFVCPTEWRIGFEDIDADCGWYIESTTEQYLHKDLLIHNGSGWDQHKYGEAPGYWPTKEAAENALKQYLEKESCGKTK